MQENLFKDFEKVSDSQWKQKIIADLKGKSYDDIHWTLKEDFVIHSYYTENDVKKIDFPILRTQNSDQISSGWQIGETIFVKDIKKANLEALDILMKGVTAPNFHFYATPSQEEFNTLFNDVEIEFISTHFSFNTDNIDYLEFYSLWKTLLKNRNLESTFACFDFDALLLDDESNMENMAKIVSQNKDFAQETIHINCKKFHTNVANTEIELDYCMEKAKKYFDYFLTKGIPAKDIASQTYFTINIGNSFLVEVAKIRALKMRWIELLKSYQVEAKLPFVKVNFSPDAYTDSKDDNLIHGTSLAMSAVIGGANHLNITPIDTSDKAKRLARNIQLILKHESGFHLVADPMAGSYYIEALTDMLLNKNQ